MTDLSADNISKWYSLLKGILVDVRGQTFNKQQAKLERYQQLYDAVRAIHLDYLRLFTEIIDSLMAAKNLAEIEKSKHKFLKSRSLHSADRSLSKFDAQTYLSLTEDIAEKRYLLTIITYFYYDMDPIRYANSLNQVDMMIWEAANFGGDKGWNSASTRFWGLVQYSADREEIIDHARKILDAVGERFALIERTFSELEGNWRHSRPISESEVTPLLLKTD